MGSDTEILATTVIVTNQDFLNHIYYKVPKLWSLSSFRKESGKFKRLIKITQPSCDKARLKTGMA